MKQNNSSKNTSGNSSKASLDTLSQLQSQLGTLNKEKTVTQSTFAQKEICIDSLNKEKTVIQDTFSWKEHIETLQDRITELQDKKKFMSVQTKQLRTELKEASEENTLKQQTIDNLERKQQKVNQYIQKLTKTESLKTDLKNSQTNNSNKNDERVAEVEEGITTKSKNAELERKIKELEQINSILEDNNNIIYGRLNIKTNERTRTLQDLKSRKENSQSEKKDFHNKLKMLNEENNDFRK